MNWTGFSYRKYYLLYSNTTYETRLPSCCFILKTIDYAHRAHENNRNKGSFDFQSVEKNVLGKKNIGKIQIANNILQ